jgi:3-hydroxyacyl-[acyl-carrier-protein] dehydratase
MILRDSFYSVIKNESSPGSIKALLAIQRDHAIFLGHFPGQPVVPGVCMMQMIKELMELNIQRKLQISTADNMKFLSVIDPRQNAEVEAMVSYTEDQGSYVLTASLTAGDVIFFKLKATLQNV